MQLPENGFSDAGLCETKRTPEGLSGLLKAGLQISSSPVESLIKQFNQRVKGTEKFWQRNWLEAVLQSRAAYLSEDGRDKKFWAERKSVGRTVGRNRLQSCPNPVARPCS